MARFISRSPKFSAGVRGEIREDFATGQHRIVQTALEARFDRRVPTDYEKEIGAAHFSFPGVPEDRDTRTDVSPFSRISGFDSEQARVQNGWTEDEETLVVESLRSHPQYGSMLLEVEEPRRPAPWAGYDALAPDRIALAVQATGVDVREVIAYEQENENREAVLADLELLLEDEPSPVTVEA